jgi:hypothetical protein
LKVCLLFLFARMPAAAQGMDKVNLSPPTVSKSLVITRLSFLLHTKYF